MAIGDDAISRELNLYLVVLPYLLLLLLLLLLRTRPFLSALQVIQVVRSCPIRSCPNKRLLCGPKIFRRTENQNLRRKKTFPSDAVMFLRCRIHGGASSSNSLCPQQLRTPQKNLRLSNLTRDEFSLCDVLPDSRLATLPPSDGLC